MGEPVTIPEVGTYVGEYYLEDEGKIMMDGTGILTSLEILPNGRPKTIYSGKWKDNKKYEEFQIFYGDGDAVIHIEFVDDEVILKLTPSYSNAFQWSSGEKANENFDFVIRDGKYVPNIKMENAGLRYRENMSLNMDEWYLQHDKPIVQLETENLQETM